MAKELNNLQLPIARLVKNLLAMRETWVRCLVWEDSLEKGMVIHSSISAWKIPWTEEPGGLQCMRLQLVMTELAHTDTMRIYYNNTGIYRK